MNRDYRTTDQLLEIYHSFHEGISTRQIADNVGIPIAQVSLALHTLDKYLKGKDKGQRRRSDSYILAAKIIRKENRTQEPQITRIAGNEAPLPVNQNLASLKDAFDQFQSAVTSFIKNETNTGQMALRLENKALREEVERLTQKIEELRSNNWIEALEDTLKEEEE